MSSQLPPLATESVPAPVSRQGAGAASTGDAAQFAAAFADAIAAPGEAVSAPQTLALAALQWTKLPGDGNSMPPEVAAEDGSDPDPEALALALQGQLLVPMSQVPVQPDGAEAAAAQTDLLNAASRQPASQRPAVLAAQLLRSDGTALSAPGADAQPARPTTDAPQGFASLMQAAATSGAALAPRNAGAVVEKLIGASASSEAASAYAPSQPQPLETLSRPAQAPPLPTQMDSPAWRDALGERVTWMVGRDLQAAQIKLNPPQLGELTIRISVHHDQATVSFTAQHASVSDQIQSAVPRLREMLADSGLNLADVNVSHREPESRQHGDQSAAPAAWSDEAPSDVAEDPVSPGRMRIGNGLLDDYA